MAQKNIKSSLRSIRRDAIVLFVGALFLLSGSVFWNISPGSGPSVVSAAPDVFALSVSPAGSAFELGVDAPQTFTALAVNGSAPYSYGWVVSSSGDVNVSLNGMDYVFCGRQSQSFNGSSLTVMYLSATTNYLKIDVSVVDFTGRFLQLPYSLMVADPYTSPGYKFDASTADYNQKVTADGKGWFRVLSGLDGSQIESSSSPNTSLNYALALGGKTVVENGSYAGALVVVPAEATLIVYPNVTGIKYATIGNGARVDEPNFNAAFGGFIGGSYTIATNHTAQATVATWYLAFKPDNSVYFTSTNPSYTVNNANALAKLNGGIVTVSTGVYLLTSSAIKFSGAFTFIGFGNGTVFKVADGANINAFEITDWSTLSNRQTLSISNFVIDGNKAHNNFYGTLSGNGIVSVGSTLNAVQMYLEKINIKNTAGFAINVTGSLLYVQNNFVEDSCNFGTFITGGDNHVEDNDFGSGLGLFGGTNAYVERNSVFSTPNNYTYFPAAIIIKYFANVQCRGNLVVDNQRNGLQIVPATFISGFHRTYLIDGNIFTNNGMAVRNGYAQIMINGGTSDYPAQDVSITNNHMFVDTTSQYFGGNFPDYGIYLDDYVCNITIAGNHVQNHTVANLGYGVNYHLSGQLKIEGNIGIDTVKELFVPFTVVYGGGSLLLTSGIYACAALVDNATTSGFCTSYLPADVKNVTSVSVLTYPNGASGNIKFKIFCNYAHNGQTYNAGNAVDGSEVATVTSNTIYKFTLPNNVLASAVAGDMVGLQFERWGAHADDTLAANLNVLGFVISYT
jgi:hypothetical protein